MDGVIFNTEALVLECWEELGEKYGYTNIRDMFVKCIGTNHEKTKQIVYDFYSGDFPYDTFRKESSLLFQEKIKGKGIPVKKGVRELLTYLHEQDFIIGLASSTRKCVVEQELSQAGLLSYFTVVMGGDQVTHSKPDPEIYARACKELHVNPSETYAIEDSINGVKSAYAAKMKVLMVPDLIPPNDEMHQITTEIFETLLDVLEYLKKC